MTNQQTPAVQIESLSRRFRGTLALDNVSLEIPQGSVYGLVGLNGAGKTTLIQHLIGSMKALHGRVVVLGHDPTIQPENLLAKIGYMSEEDSLPGWMRLRDLLDFCRNVYPTWSDAYAAELCDMFSLSPASRLKSLSKGGRARVALMAAIAHRPELLILDEPSSGLDPIARADILEAIIRTVAEDGRTVLFSSHLLEEIDRVCDHIALLHHGKLLETIDADCLSESYEELHLQSDCQSQAAPEIDGCFGIIGDSHEWSLLAPKNVIADNLPSVTDQNGVQWTLTSRQSASVHRWFTARVQRAPVSATMQSNGELQNV